MARTPTIGPGDIDVATGAPAPYQSNTASPNAFGFGSALKGLAADMDTAGGEIKKQVLASQQLDNETTATNISALGAQRFGDAWAKFSTLESGAAVAAYPQFQTDIAKMRDDLIAEGKNPVAAQMVSRDIQRQYNNFNESAALHFAKQTKLASGQSSEARQAALVNQAVLLRTDPNKVAMSVDASVSEVDKQAEIHGWDLQTTQRAKSEAYGEAYGPVISALVADGMQGTLQAQRLFDQMRPLMDAKSQARISTFLKEKVDGARGDAIFMGITGQAASGIPPGNTDRTALATAQWAAESSHSQTDRTGQPLRSMPNDPDSPVGYTQIKPSTAAETARRIGVPFDPKALAENSEYNRQLGTAHMDYLLGKYDNNPTVALAAYHAGEGNVAKWLKPKDQGGLGNPVTGEVSNAEWAAAIPGPATRAYVAKVGSTMGGLPGQNFATPNPATKQDMMQQALEQTRGMDPAIQMRVISRVSSYTAARDAGQAQERAQLQHRLSDLEPALLGGQDLPIPEADIRRLLPPADAERMVTNLGYSKIAGEMFKGVATATPVELEQMQRDLISGQGIFSNLLKGRGAKLAAGMQQPTEDNPPSPEQADFRLRAAVAQRLQGMIAERQTRLKEDPASYAANVDTDVAKASRDIGQPGGMQRYATAVLTAQERLGVPEYERKILTKPQVQNIIGTWMKADPADPKTDIGMVVQQTAAGFGDQWGRAYGQLVTDGKLPREWQAVATMDAPGQLAARQDLIRMMQAGGSAVLEKGPAASMVPQIRDAMQSDTTLQQFNRTASVAGASNTERMKTDVWGTVRDLALYYAANGETNGAAAVRKAAEGVIGAKYDFDGTMRYPKGMAPLVDRSTSALERSVNGNPQALADLPPDPGFPNVSQAKLKEIVAGAPKVWIPNERDDGLVMLATRRDGYNVPIRTADGKRVEILFKDMPSFAKEPGTRRDDAGMAPATLSAP